MKNQLITHAKALRCILGFYESEKARIATILHLAGIAEAKLHFNVPEPDEDRNKTIDRLATSLILEYTTNEKTYSLQSIRLGATTYDGVPVLSHPNGCPSLGHLIPLMQNENLDEVLRTYQGASIQDAYLRVCANIVTLDLESLDEQTETNDIDA